MPSPLSTAQSTTTPDAVARGEARPSGRERLDEYELVFLKLPNGHWSGRLEAAGSYLIWSCESEHADKAGVRSEAANWYANAAGVLV
jgi:hypothetical protein